MKPSRSSKTYNKSGPLSTYGERPFDTQQSMDFLVMEYISGMMLSEKLSARPLSEMEVISLGTQLAEGLCAAHEHGVVHSRESGS